LYQGKFLTDGSLYNNLDNAAVMVARLVLRLDGVLKDVAIVADKLARHPESLELGGRLSKAQLAGCGSLPVD
jgi:hypothetical protein